VEAESYIVHSRSKHQDRSGAFAFDLVFRQGSKGYKSLESTVLKATGQSGLGRSSLGTLVSRGSSVFSLGLGSITSSKSGSLVVSVVKVQTCA